MSLTHGGAALQVVAKLLAPIKQSQIKSGAGGGNSIVCFPLTGSSNICTYNWGGKKHVSFTDELSVKSLCIYLLWLLHT